jgi:hypothetical protein
MASDLMQMEVWKKVHYFVFSQLWQIRWDSNTWIQDLSPNMKTVVDVWRMCALLVGQATSRSFPAAAGPAILYSRQPSSRPVRLLIHLHADTRRHCVMA